MLIQLSIASTSIFIPLEDSQRLFISFVNHPEVSSSPLADTISGYGSYTVTCNSSPPISFSFICTVGLQQYFTFSVFRHFGFRQFDIHVTMCLDIPSRDPRKGAWLL